MKAKAPAVRRPSLTRVVFVSTVGNSYVADGDPDAMYADACRLTGLELDEYRAELDDGAGFGCALANLLQDGYLVRRISKRSDEPDYWRVALRWHEAAPGCARPWNVAYLRYATGETRALCGDSRRYDLAAGQEFARILFSSGWADKSITEHRDDDSSWLVIAERESERPD